MFMNRNNYEKGFQDGYDRGKVTGIISTLLIASPFIIAGAKVLFEKSTPAVKKGMKKIQDTDLYTRYFNKDEYLQRNFEKTRSMYGQDEELTED